MNANRKKEGKEECFARIATARVNKIAAMVRLLGNCPTLSNYIFSEEQVNKIFEYLQNKINKAKARFNCVLHNSGILLEFVDYYSIALFSGGGVAISSILIYFY